MFDWLFGSKGNLISAGIWFVGAIVFLIIGIAGGHVLYGLGLAALAVGVGLARLWFARRFVSRARGTHSS
jgi:hypothetical protein